MNVTEAVSSRRSVRAFLETPVEEEVVRRLLLKSSRSASGGNLQPWHVSVLSGKESAVAYMQKPHVSSRRLARVVRDIDTE